MKRSLLLLSLMGTLALAQSFQTIDRVDGWLIECKRDSEQNYVCRASLPGGGSWFSARVHLNLNDALVVPQGLIMSKPSRWLTFKSSAGTPTMPREI
jgi:hypothetical protein